MTKQDKELLLKDLCARLPYCVYIGDEYANKWELVGIEIDENTVMFKQQSGENLGITPIEGVKPYLRPMSSMTNEEKKYVNELIYDKDGLFLSPTPIWVINECDIDKYVDFCNSKHLDWRGLISKGLALPAPEDMYNF